ncbi:MAG: 2-oxoacid:acceptor oxidoreductase family protein [Proteobacteria bacterium]|nr:2-oxoacid:acceptor oxidoreductase family protein [Pseudomonadota bacterium]
MVNRGAGGQKRIKLAGFGGQGLILAGTILGKAAILGGKEVLQGQSYGPASRGGTCESNVVISGDDIHELSFAGQEFDMIVCLSQLAFDRYSRSLKEDGLLIVDEGFVKDMKMGREGVELLRVPFTKIAEELGNRAVANIVMLGCLVNKTELVSREHLREAVLDTIPKGTEGLNVRALEKGFRLGMGE